MYIEDKASFVSETPENTSGEANMTTAESMNVDSASQAETPVPSISKPKEDKDGVCAMPSPHPYC